MNMKVDQSRFFVKTSQPCEAVILPLHSLDTLNNPSDFNQSKYNEIITFYHQYGDSHHQVQRLMKECLRMVEVNLYESLLYSDDIRSLYEHTASTGLWQDFLQEQGYAYHANSDEPFVHWQQNFLKKEYSKWQAQGYGDTEGAQSLLDLIQEGCHLVGTADRTGSSMSSS
jgi:hypothetical protein